MNPEVHIKTEHTAHTVGQSSQESSSQDNQGYTPNLDHGGEKNFPNFNPVAFHNVSQLGKYFVFTNLLQGGSSIYTLPKLPVPKDAASETSSVILSGGATGSQQQNQQQHVPVSHAITIPTSVIGKIDVI